MGDVALHCALCKERLTQETERVEKPFLKYSAAHVGQSPCPAQTTWVYVWKDEGFWREHGG